jgi:hypothetical protein
MELRGHRTPACPADAAQGVRVFPLPHAALGDERLGRILRHWKSRTLSICFRHWHALVFPAVPRGPSAREQQQYWHGVRELLARPCLKKGRYSRRWRVVQLSISSAGELVYASRSSGHVKMRHVSLSWITRVEPVGATRYGLGLSAFIGVGAGACYKWRMELNTLGRQHCGTRHLIFGCESADAMHCWLDELARGRGIGGIGGVAVGGGGGVTSIGATAALAALTAPPRPVAPPATPAGWASQASMQMHDSGYRGGDRQGLPATPSNTRPRPSPASDTYSARRTAPRLPPQPITPKQRQSLPSTPKQRQSLPSTPSGGVRSRPSSAARPMKVPPSVPEYDYDDELGWVPRAEADARVRFAAPP